MSTVQFHGQNEEYSPLYPQKPANVFPSESNECSFKITILISTLILLYLLFLGLPSAFTFMFSDKICMHVASIQCLLSGLLIISRFYHRSKVCCGCLFERAFTSRCVIPVVCVTNEREENVVKQHN